MRLTLVFLFLSVTLFSYSQSSVTISGKIIDKSSGEPLEFATVAFIKSGTTEIVTGGITDFDGFYAISVPAGTYDIRYEYISYETQVIQNQNITENRNMPPVIMDLDLESLDEVVIRAEVTEMSIRLDRKIYNIGKDLTARGATIGDALTNIPSVDVDIEGAVSLRGNQNVTILINGRPSAMAGLGDTDALNQLPAEAIERIEVITSPSARYDAEGTAGIINIILKQDSILGFNGSVSANIGYPTTGGITANINYRARKFNIFTNTGYSYREFLGSGRNYNTFENSIYSSTLENRESSRIRKGFNTNLGIEYFINDKSSFTVSGFANFRDGDDLTTAITRKNILNQLAERSVREEREFEDDKTYQAAFNYTNNFNSDGHKLTVDFQYDYKDEVEDSYLTEYNTFGETTLYPSEDIITDLKRNTILAQADYVLPLGENAQFEAGYRGNFRNSVTDYQLFAENIETGQMEYNELLSNVFDYTENIQALYTQYGNKFGKFSFLAGLRLESTQLKGAIEAELTQEELEDIFGVFIDTNFEKDYLGLFPTVNLVYELSDGENITLGYNRRINRPRGWDINPFPSRSSVTNVYQGNPDLDPAYASAFDLGYMKRFGKLTLTTSVYYQHETDAFERVQIRTGEVINGVDVLRTIPINLSTNQRIGAEAGFMYNPTRWLRLNSSFNFFQFDSDGQFEGVEYGAKNTSWFGRFNARVSLPGNIDWQTNMFYRGPSENAQTRSKGMYSIDLGLAKDLNDNTSLSFNVSDLLNSRKRESYTVGNGFTSDSEYQWRPRQFTFSITYRFNQQKQQDRKQQKRTMENGNDEFEGGGF
jgi:outer membrane receptor for ferrienterochelin and colicin